MPSKKKYKVIGAAPVLGHGTGETFEASLDKAQEDFLVSIGGLEVVKVTKDKAIHHERRNP